MLYEEESDYIMRMIKEMVRVLFSLLLGKQYTQVELLKENRFLVSGRKLEDFLKMVDQGKINEAENLLLDKLDYENPEELAAASLFYGYIGEKEPDFLKACDYSLEEAAEGVKQIGEYAGYGPLMEEIKL